MLIQEFYNKHWLLFSLIILGVSTLLLIVILYSVFCTEENLICNQYKSFIPSFIEIGVGLGIALIIHNHTMKIQKKEDAEVLLTVHGIYLHLWNLHLSLLPYISSADVRSDKSTTIQILNSINNVEANLAKCAKLISNEIIEKLQLHLILIRTAISVSLDPRSDIEVYWNSNVNKVKIALDEIKKIAKTEFEKYSNKEKIVWREID